MSPPSTAGGTGPVLLSRGEDERVLFGFWRGQRFLELEPRLEAGGKYEMASIGFRQGATIAPTVARRLTRAAVAVNMEVGDPTASVRAATRRARTQVAKTARRG